MNLRIFSLASYVFLYLILIFVPITGKELPDTDNWKNSILNHRKEKDNYFKTSPTSPMAGYKRVTLNKKSSIYIKLEPGSIVLSEKKIQSFNAEIFFNKGKWNLLRKKDEIIEELTGFNSTRLGKYTLKFYPIRESIILVFFNPQRNKIREFKHLYYFPPNTEFRIRGKLVRFKNPEKIMVPTSRKLEKTFFRYGKFKFRLKGKDYELTVLKSSLDPKEGDSKYLFIPFADKTSGYETYEGGRFIEIDEPEGEDMTLDFNLCFNPLCNYADVYNCPLPPLENELDIRIEAGEKTFPH